MKDFYNWLEERFDMDNPQTRDHVHANQDKLLQEYLREEHDYISNEDYD